MTDKSLPPEKSRKTNFSTRFQILIIVVIILALVYSGAWLFGARMVRTQIETAMADYATPQTMVACDDLAVGGFPFRYDVTCTNLSLIADDIALAVPELKATVLVYRPTHLLWFARGPAAYTDAFTGIDRQLSWDQLRGSARTNGWALARISIEGDGLTLTDTLLTERTLGHLTHIEAHALDSAEKYNAETGRAEVAIFIEAIGASLEDQSIKNGTLRLEAEVPGMPDDLRLWTPETLARNWQNDPVRVVGLHAEDTGVEIDIVGTVGTTADANLTGDFDLNTRNLYEPLSALIAPQMLDTFLGQKSEDGSYYRSYALRNGVLMAGNLPVVTLPPLL